jgi:hypothetical protein
MSTKIRVTFPNLSIFAKKRKLGNKIQKQKRGKGARAFFFFWTYPSPSRHPLPGKKRWPRCCLSVSFFARLSFWEPRTNTLGDVREGKGEVEDGRWKTEDGREMGTEDGRRKTEYGRWGGRRKTEGN